MPSPRCRSIWAPGSNGGKSPPSIAVNSSARTPSLSQLMRRRRTSSRASDVSCDGTAVLIPALADPSRAVCNAFSLDNERAGAIEDLARHAEAGHQRGFRIERRRVAFELQVKIPAACTDRNFVHVADGCRIGDQANLCRFKTETGDRHGRRYIGVLRIFGGCLPGGAVKEYFGRGQCVEIKQAFCRRATPCRRR